MQDRETRCGVSPPAASFPRAFGLPSDRPQTVLVVGAASGIAQALCQRFAQRGDRLILAGRNLASLEALERELTQRHPGARCCTQRFDALQFDQFDPFLEASFSAFPNGLDGVVLCHALLPDQSHSETDAELTRRVIDTNYTSAVLLLNRLALRMIDQRRGWIAVISSVAGDRGRRSNYLYGSTKAGLSTFLQGLRSRLHPHGIPVLTVKPGYVATPMIDGRVNKSSWLVATPDRVARDIERAIRRRRNIVYTPWFWRVILGVARAIPEFLFKRLSF